MAELWQHLSRWDAAISRRVTLTEDQRQARPPRFWLAHVGAHLGDSWLWALIALFLWRDAQRRAGRDNGRRRRIVFAWLGSVVGGFLLTLAIKQVVRRPRPDSGPFLHAAGPDVHSFPSGHANRVGTIVAWATALAPGWGRLFWPIALWIGWSRIVLGIHYVSDVLVGFALGVGVGAGMRRATAATDDDGAVTRRHP